MRAQSTTYMVFFFQNPVHVAATVKAPGAKQIDKRFDEMQNEMLSKWWEREGLILRGYGVVIPGGKRV